MGLLHENEAGYESASILNYVGSYRGGLMLIHGTGDDNVHPQHTWQLVQKLVEANQPFDMMMYPNQTHSIADRKYHLFSKMTKFFKERL
jgi:dipeptidyl-peptidase-4